LALIEEQQQQQNEDPMLAFTYALRAYETKRQWPKRLKIFFDFLNLEGAATVEQQAKQFIIKARQNSQWAQEGYGCLITIHLFP
jgi:hypothetical protein